MTFKEKIGALTKTPARAAATAATATLLLAYAVEGTACGTDAFTDKNACGDVARFVGSFLPSVLQTGHVQANFAIMTSAASVAHGVFAGIGKAVKDRFCKGQDQQSALQADLLEDGHAPRTTASINA